MRGHHKTDSGTEPQGTLKSWARWTRGNLKNSRRFRRKGEGDIHGRVMRWKPTGEIFKEEGVISGIKYGHTLKRSRIYLCFLQWDSLVALPVTFKSGFWAPGLDLQFPIRHFSACGHKELKPSTPKTESVMFSVSTLKLFLFSGSSCQWMSPPYAYDTWVPQYPVPSPPSQLKFRHHLHVFQIKAFTLSFFSMIGISYRRR